MAKEGLTIPPGGIRVSGMLPAKKSVSHRLKIARGHLDKIVRMVENGDYCIDILTQSQAVQSALRQTDALILEDHLKHCVADAVQGSAEAKDQAITEVVKVFRQRP